MKVIEENGGDITRKRIDQIGATHTLLQPLHDFEILAKAFTIVERQEHT